ncbi:flagellar biosynthesis protein FlhB [Alkaliphilus hydrothermalis]|uniref:Flagellar biosynthetic protein FlhB n=1 Tax=Alkaliphilus hydrothermalis TaxID=1482730 RepID=A0ABS2NL65_9FIRM|nr:flagellar biosynthesis protein FlhB [Alkaliphilus hydrothermalis]MBM7613675.1 flagellar biosynthetic protein FlhB [Alkaliphilus hydrothermalis]
MELIIDLQLFSEEKTEKPTPKKIRESREKGQVLQSKEVVSAFMMLGAFAGIGLFSSYIGENIHQLTKYIYEDYLTLEHLFTQRNIYQLMVTSVYYLFLTVIPIAGICFLIGLVSSYMQVGFLFTTKTLSVKFSRINPLEGFKRLFSMKSLVELGKSLIKIIFVGYVVINYGKGQLESIFKTTGMDVLSIISTLKTLALGIGYRAGLILVFIALLDYFYQRYDYYKNLKMSKQEIKEEYKQTEGNPQIKSKIKEKQRQISMRRMMQDVPKADVIITNPTHFAIAIQYDPKSLDAPRVLAKGQDLMAQQIKKIGGEHQVPIVENKPLARTLFATVEIGYAIPPDLYQAVAEVLAYVYRINNKN